MAHQAHALPWNTLGSLFQYKFSHTIEPQRKEIILIQKESEPKEIAYFCRAFAQRVRDFSQSERAKFDSCDIYQRRAESWVKAATNGGQPGSEEVRLVFPEVFNDRYFGPSDGSDDDRFRNHLCWGDTYLQSVSEWSKEELLGSRIDYGDTLKLMMMEAAGTSPALSASPAPEAASLKKHVMESMLLLANHPATRSNLRSFVNMHHGHHFGVSRVAEEAVRSYMYLNLLVAMQENRSDVCNPAKDEDGLEIPGQKNYMNLLSFKRMLNSVAGTYDGDSQNLVHWDFFYNRIELGWDHENPKDILEDREALAEYLKSIWRVLVVYDLVIREAGGDPDLEGECRRALIDNHDLKLGYDV